MRLHTTVSSRRSETRRMITMTRDAEPLLISLGVAVSYSFEMKRAYPCSALLCFHSQQLRTLHGLTLGNFLKGRQLHSGLFAGLDLVEEGLGGPVGVEARCRYLVAQLVHDELEVAVKFRH